MVNIKNLERAEKTERAEKAEAEKIETNYPPFKYIPKMSYHKIPASELRMIASDTSNVKIYTMTEEYYNKILKAAKEGKFSIVFFLEGEDSKDGDKNKISFEEEAVIDTMKEFFPGINVDYDMRFLSCCFSW